MKHYQLMALLKVERLKMWLEVEKATGFDTLVSKHKEDDHGIARWALKSRLSQLEQMDAIIEKTEDDYKNVYQFKPKDSF